VRERFPQWTVPDDMRALYQADGGLVDAAMGIAVHVQLARAHGATIIENCKVTRVEPETNGTVLVSTIAARSTHIAYLTRFFNSSLECRII
jgi:glycine/D-amino acid oxidase-like deaminating enzyme